MCDTFVALPPATAGAVVFAKNSDRPEDEGQSIRRYPAAAFEPGAVLRCTYISVPQALETAALLLSQPDWMWGAEMGANGHGVVIGNEAVWTSEALGPPALLGMDLVRLGLERGRTARLALGVITGLLEEFGQGGACAENDPSFAYHNSFLIADRREAWVLETAARHWAAKRIVEGCHNISNGLTIRDDFDLASESLAGGTDFAAAFALGSVDAEPKSRQALGSVDAEPKSRQEWGRRLLAESAVVTPQRMMEILKHHESGICMHGGFSTTASMVSSLAPSGEATHWMTGAPHPCRAAFREVSLSG